MNNPLPESPQQEVFVRYIEAFSNKEFAAVASNFSIPALLISSGKPLYIDSTEKLIGLMTTLRKSLPAEYTHTAMQEFELFQFNKNSAAAHITYERRAEDNTALSTEQGVYYFCKKAEQWQIFSVVLG